MGIASEVFKLTSINHGQIFHVHTDYTDGSSTVADYVEYASEHNCRTLIFTEHVRKELSYSFTDFLSDIDCARQRVPGLTIIAGAEANILPGGGLNISDDVMSRIDVICFACHSFPENVALYEDTFRRVFKDRRWEDHVRVWVHPGRFLKRRGLLEKNISTLKGLIDLAAEQNVLIERNLKENLPPAGLLERISSDKIINGYDAHSVDELRRLQHHVPSSPGPDQ